MFCLQHNYALASIQQILAEAHSVLQENFNFKG